MKKLFLALLTLSFFIAAPALANATSGAKKAANEAAAQAAGERVLERVFSEAEKALIEEYFGVRTTDEGADNGKGKKGKKNDKHDGLPPGLAKKDHLPPGLQKQLERNGHLPPGLEKRDLPPDLERRLAKLAKGTKRAIVGSDIVLIEEATGLILDVLLGAAKN